MVRRTSRAIGLALLCPFALLGPNTTVTPKQEAFATPSLQAHATAKKGHWGVSRVARRQSTSTIDMSEEVGGTALQSVVSLGLFSISWLGVFAGSMNAMYGAEAGRQGLIGMASLLVLGLGGTGIMNRIKKAMVPWSDNEVAAGRVAPQSVVVDPTLGAVIMQAIGLLAVAAGGLYWYGGALLAARGIVGVVGLYAIMSLNEYIIHRYYQHLGLNKQPLYRFLRTKCGFPIVKTSGHVEHHKETKDDMTLDRRPDANLDADPFRGTAFSWDVTGSMMAQIAIQSYPFLWLCGWSLKASTLAFLAAMMLHAMVWQTLHPAMHQLPDPPLKYGVPGWSMKWLRNTKYFRFLYVNHEGHHRFPGAHGNYNVCCPLFDHVFGTYRGVIPPQPVTA
eukprot:TRINITY_DN4134_c0_g1_i1.p2 TRINITY_DN4134_c0_g1~~TRINITY_DN4134_c0_g1_i1.p2  ORF type:complete len:391 (-),score=88.29 TRINITY_DN4134_c0_g1_i1:128-1300(-)